MLNIRYSQLIYPDAIEDVLGGSSLEVKDQCWLLNWLSCRTIIMIKWWGRKVSLSLKGIEKSYFLLFPNFFGFRILNSLDNVDRENPAFFL